MNGRNRRADYLKHHGVLYRRPAQYVAVVPAYHPHPSLSRSYGTARSTPLVIHRGTLTHAPLDVWFPLSITIVCLSLIR